MNRNKRSIDAAVTGSTIAVDTGDPAEMRKWSEIAAIAGIKVD